MRTRPSWLAALLPLAFGHLTACGGGDAATAAVERPPSGTPGSDTGTPARPPAAPGTYEVDSAFDLTAATLAPQAAVDDVRLLRSLHDDPMGTFVRVLDERGVPLAGELYAALPGVLEDKIAGWFNEAMLSQNVGGQPVGAELDVLLALADTTLVRFDLLTDLSLPGAPSVAVHGFRGIRYDFLGGRLPVVVTRFVDEHTPIVTETEVAVRVSGGEAGHATLELGDHAFGIPYGRYAVAAIDRACVARYGAPLREALRQLVGCSNVAQTVAGKCIGFACVGHASELTELCESGLDHVVQKIHDGLTAYDFDAAHFRAGRAELWDAPPEGARDGRMDCIAAGVWDASIDVGQGPREVRATFTGVRR
jgi:hypothetical protein